MNLSRRRALEWSLSMAAASGLAQFLHPTSPSRIVGAAFSLSTTIPQSFGDWVVDRASYGIVRAASGRDRIYNSYDELLERTFVNWVGYRIMLSVASSNGLPAMQLHMPEICYSMSGYQVEDVEPTTLLMAGHPVLGRQLRTELPGRPEPVTYWMIVAGKIMTGTGANGFGSWDFRWHRIGLALKREPLNGILIRISSIDPDERRAFEIHAGFADEMMRKMLPDVRQRFIG